MLLQGELFRFQGISLFTSLKRYLSVEGANLLFSGILFPDGDTEVVGYSLGNGGNEDELSETFIISSRKSDILYE